MMGIALLLSWVFTFIIGILISIVVIKILNSFIGVIPKEGKYKHYFLIYSVAIIFVCLFMLIFGGSFSALFHGEQNTDIEHMILFFGPGSVFISAAVGRYISYITFGKSEKV